MSYEKYLYGGADSDTVDKLTGLVNIGYEYCTMSISGASNEIETYDFYDSSGGSVIRTVVVTYVGADRETLVSAERTA